MLSINDEERGTLDRSGSPSGKVEEKLSKPEAAVFPLSSKQALIFSKYTLSSADKTSLTGGTTAIAS